MLIKIRIKILCSCLKLDDVSQAEFLNLFGSRHSYKVNLLLWGTLDNIHSWLSIGILANGKHHFTAPYRAEASRLRTTDMTSRQWKCFLECSLHTCPEEEILNIQIFFRTGFRSIVVGSTKQQHKIWNAWKKTWDRFPLFTYPIRCVCLLHSAKSESQFCILAVLYLVSKLPYVQTLSDKFW